MSQISSPPDQTPMSQTFNQVAEVDKLYRRNFIYSMGNALFYAFGESLVDTRVVMTAFLSQLTSSNTLIALLAPMRQTGWFLPQFFAAIFCRPFYWAISR